VTGPLAGTHVVEFAGIGPAPFATMMLSDMGATVIRIDRPVTTLDRKSARSDLVSRGRRSIAINLKSRRAESLVKCLIREADVLIEGFRPGTMERLGVGPDACEELNPRLVYGRMTGWGQTGPLAHTAGHDINYIALSGALGAIGRVGQAPVPPLNLVGDYGGGGMLLAFGVLAALLARDRTGRGQVVDAAMTDGSAILMSAIYGLRQAGEWKDRRGQNLLDSGTPYYDAYETADGEYVSVGALEPQFFARLIEVLGCDPGTADMHLDASQWPRLRQILTDKFRTRSQAEWSDLFAETDACVTPVMSMGEAPQHPHNAARGTFVTHHGAVQPAPAPRFSHSRTALSIPPPYPGEHTLEILAELGFDSTSTRDLLEEGAVAVA
jgi:alpha-methylacyl-CoA racemase